MADDELRMLRAQAYGRGDGLTEDQLARLRELEEGAADGGGAFDSSLRSSLTPFRLAPLARRLPDDAPATDVPPVVERSGAAAEMTRGERDAGESNTILRHEHPSRRTRLVIVAAVALLVGLGAGWLLWNRPAPAIALTTEQQAWQTDLIDDDAYDPGSIRAVQQYEGVVAWLATADEGAQDCVILSDGVNVAPNCVTRAEEPESPLWGELQSQLDDPAGTTQSTTATVIFTAGGDPAVAMQQFSYVSSVTDQLTSEEREAYDLLTARGYAGSSLWIAGHFDDVPVWIGSTNPASGQMCLIRVVDDVVAEGCADNVYAEETTVNLVTAEGENQLDLSIDFADGPQTLVVRVTPLDALAAG